MWKFFGILLFTASVQGAFWQSCNLAGVNTPDDIVSANCPVGATRCSVARNETLHGEALFTPTGAYQELITTARAHHLTLPGGVNIPMTPPHDNACNDLYDVGTGNFAGCPTVGGNQKVWRLEFTVPTGIPALNNVRVRMLLNDRGTDVGCVDIYVNIS